MKVRICIDNDILSIESPCIEKRVSCAPNVDDIVLLTDKEELELFEKVSKIKLYEDDIKSVDDIRDHMIVAGRVFNEKGHLYIFLK